MMEREREFLSLYTNNISNKGKAKQLRPWVGREVIQPSFPWREDEAAASFAGRPSSGFLSCLWSLILAMIAAALRARMSWADRVEPAPEREQSAALSALQFAQTRC